MILFDWTENQKINPKHRDLDTSDNKAVSGFVVDFKIPPRYSRKVEKEDLKYIENILRSTLQDQTDRASVFFRNLVQGCNGAPKFVLRDHKLDLESGTIGGVLQLARDRRFEISFGVPKGMRRTDMISKLRLVLEKWQDENGCDVVRQDAKNPSTDNVPNVQVNVPQVPLVVTSPENLEPVLFQAGRQQAQEEEVHINFGRFTKILADQEVRSKIVKDLERHANPDGSVAGGYISAILAEYMGIQSGDLIAPAYNALVSEAHHSPLLEREVLEDGTKRYWLPGRMPRPAYHEGYRAVTPAVVDQVKTESDQGVQLLDDCDQGLRALGRLIEVVRNQGPQSKELENLRAELARARYDRERLERELAKAQKENEQLQAGIDYRDKEIKTHSDKDRRCQEIASALEVARAEITALREENNKLTKRFAMLKEAIG